MAAPAGKQILMELDHSGLEREDYIRAYRMIYTSRCLDDREILLKRQQKIYFQVSGAGHEAVQTAAGIAMKAGYDWFFPYYRDRALCLTLGITPELMLLQAVGSSEDTMSGGRQMPTHWSAPELRIVTGSSCTGTQLLPAVGCAQASRILHPDLDEVTLACGGDGHISQGEFWESINASCLEKLPIVFLIEDNGFAISTPVEKQTAGGSVSKLVQSFPDLLVEEVDGCDFPASYEVMKKAVAHCRQGLGPRAGSRTRHTALRAFAIRRRLPVQNRRRTRRRTRPGSIRPFSRMADFRGETRPAGTGTNNQQYRRRNPDGHRQGAQGKNAFSRFRPALCLR